MAPTDEALAALQDGLRAHADRIEIAGVCDRYLRHLDKDRDNDDWLDAVFTADVHLTFPIGEFTGRDGLVAFQKMARETFERTHHIASNYDIRLDGDRARVQAHLTAVHVPHRENPGEHFTVGGHYEAQTVRGSEGWRISAFSFDLVWHAGDGPLAKTGGAAGHGSGV
ncbi:nuclear transport factor 2 family protein [Streptomyces sp. RerS4]|uniref:nuclear transport factor 2 family protein n=1 Tax=Streptomyces sp. RerS4 TaxID=2942449 RepID=UPI00201BC9C0|nr:nuclear transport factor 2 family protein [Streptomyces sp. RerS4]UQX03455.1 nuclear transport factor 2 family protein [Streptomyces sp. RerS4]